MKIYQQSVRMAYLRSVFLWSAALLQSACFFPSGKSSNILPEPDAGLFGLNERSALPPLNLPGAYADGIPTNPQFLSQTDLFANLQSLEIAEGFIPYDVNHELWSNGATKKRWIGIPLNSRITYAPTGEMIFPVGTIIVKHFSIKLVNGSQRNIETRLLIRSTDGTASPGTNGWEAFTFDWAATAPFFNDAALLAAGTGPNPQVVIDNVDAALFGQAGPVSVTWTIPTNTCTSCHNTAAGFIQGFRSNQLNGAYEYDLAGQTFVDNQLRAMNNIQVFNIDLDQNNLYNSVSRVYPTIGRLVAADDVSESLEKRVKSYLAVNCSMCHQPGGSCASPGGAATDFRYETPLAGMGLININSRVVPDNKNVSLVWNFLGGGGGAPSMPLTSVIGPSLANPHAVGPIQDLFGNWIDSL